MTSPPACNTGVHSPRDGAVAGAGFNDLPQYILSVLTISEDDLAAGRYPSGDVRNDPAVRRWINAEARKRGLSLAQLVRGGSKFEIAARSITASQWAIWGSWLTWVDELDRRIITARSVSDDCPLSPDTLDALRRAALLARADIQRARP